MHRFEVWAPLAKSVSVKIADTAIAMAGPDGQGWWRVKVDSAGPGTDYGYLIDNDPRP
jgi:maltooligosyltrehalose trehalohydrolase